MAVSAGPIVPLDRLCASGTSYFGVPSTPYVLVLGTDDVAELAARMRVDGPVDLVVDPLFGAPAAAALRVLRPAPAASRRVGGSCRATRRAERSTE